MARIESDREDLMREASALVRRVEFSTGVDTVPLVAGFRSDGSLTIFFHADRMAQFDMANRLRRALDEGKLYRTQGTTLARLTRRRTDTATILDRHDLTPCELAEFLETLESGIIRLHAELTGGKVTILRQIPDDADVLAELSQRMDDLALRQIELAPPINVHR